MMALSRSFAPPDHAADGAAGGDWAAETDRGDCASQATVRAQRRAPPLFAVPAQPPRYCAMLAIDIQAFNDRRRGDDVQQFLRSAMYDLLIWALNRSGLRLTECHHEDRGDGVLVIAPSGAPPASVIDPLADHLRAGVRAYNKICNDLARMNLRVAVHAGQVYFDANGVCGYAVTQLFRMLEAGQVKAVLTESGSDFVLVTSSMFYEEVVSPGWGLIDPALYAPVDIECKETTMRAWLYLPPVRHPLLRSINRGGRAPSMGQGRAEQKTSDRDTRRPAPVSPLPSAGWPPITFRTEPAARPQDATANCAARANEGQPGKEPVSARARLAAFATTTRGWLATVPETLDVGRLRQRLNAGQDMQHA